MPQTPWRHSSGQCNRAYVARAAWFGTRPEIVSRLGNRYAISSEDVQFTGGEAGPKQGLPPAEEISPFWCGFVQWMSGIGAPRDRAGHSVGTLYVEALLTQLNRRIGAPNTL